MDIIRESFDILPIAICFFDADGVVRLINHRMLAVVAMLRKDGLQMLAELQEALQQPPEDVRCLNRALSIYQLPDGGILQFSTQSVITKSGDTYTQVLAKDVGELVRKQQLLHQENKRLADANRRTRKLISQMPEIIRQEETLLMKMRVHDDIGHSLLSARRTLVREESLETIRANAAEWTRCISVLYQSGRKEAEQETLAYAELRASELGVRVDWDGPDPVSPSAHCLLSLAIRECAANCARHAGGTRLSVRCQRESGWTTARLTNNGTPPKGTISEGGGLSMLRQRVEAAGGGMEIQSIPVFQLTLKLPEHEEDAHAACDDC